MPDFKFDVIGYWSEIKLAIIKDYAQAYSIILNRQPALSHIYIDGFSGAGIHISRKTGEFVPGSPLNALNISPPFVEYHLIDLDSGKANNLRTITAGNPSVFVYEGDCNAILHSTVLPRARYEDFRRALCILDPYGLHLDWSVIREAGQLKTVDMFLNFPVMDMNRNVLWKNPDGVTSADAERMTRFWGDDSWRQAAYDRTNLFEFENKTDNQTVVDAFRQRLTKVGGFNNVIEPMPMRNKAGATVYYLFFASQNSVANHIVASIFSKYKDRS